MGRYLHLFEPISIAGMEIKNRINMPAMATMYASEKGEVTEKMLAYYGERAKGGAGLITVEFTCIELNGRSAANQLRIDDDCFIPGLQKLAERIKNNGARAAIQLHHAGLKAKAVINLVQPGGPSELPSYPVYMRTDPRFPPKALTLPQIERLILGFSESAVRAKKAGFDAVEIHGSHGYLLDQFMSPRFNIRSDSYGGSLENRAKFACQVLSEVKKRVGKKFPVIFRMTGLDHIKGGITIEQAKLIAHLLETAGADCLHVTMANSDFISIAPSSFPKGCFVHVAEAIKKVVKIPVIAVGRLDDPDLAESVLRENKADIVAIGRGLIADPYFPSKVKEGKLDEIIPCLACNQGCMLRIQSGMQEIRCQVNPAVGLEWQSHLVHKGPKKKVVIIGGGPAGMEAARSLALKGHNVVVYEREQEIGGMLRIGCIPPHKTELLKLIAYYQNQLTKLGVEVHLKTQATAKEIMAQLPDAVIFATGSVSFIPDLSGPGASQLLKATDVIQGKVNVGNKVVILGSRRVALETAELLLDRKKEVTVVARAPQLGVGFDHATKVFLLERLFQKGLKVHLNCLVKSIEPKGIIATHENEEIFIEADTVVIAWGYRAERKIYEEVEKTISNCDIYLLGDSLEPRTILEAIDEGNKAANEI